MEKELQNFKFIECPNEPYPMYLILLFCHSKVNQRKMILEYLNEIGYEGVVLVDNLMQVGVEGLRFYKTNFKEVFLDNGFTVTLPNDSIYRQLTCDYLREHNLVVGSNLSQRKIDAIMKGENI